METIHATEKTANDGTLTLRLPLGRPNTEFEVVVIIQARAPANGATIPPTADPWAAINAFRERLLAFIDKRLHEFAAKPFQFELVEFQRLSRLASFQVSDAGPVDPTTRSMNPPSTAVLSENVSPAGAVGSVKFPSVIPAIVPPINR